MSKSHIRYRLLLSLSLVSLSLQARVAVWDPRGETEHPRFSLSGAYMRQVAGWLTEGGVETDVLEAGQIADATQFNAQTYDALFVQGAVVPQANVAAYTRFLAAGGVLVSLDSPNFFESRIDPAASNGVWRLSPEEPRFAWNLPDINKALGLTFKTDTAMINYGVSHAVTQNLAPYLPQACGRVFSRPLSARWFLPESGVTFYPLIRSRMADGKTDYTPQVFLSVNAATGAKAILCSSGFWTAGPDVDQITSIGGQFRSMAFRPGGIGSETNEWPFAHEMVVGFAKMAADLKSGKLNPAALESVTPTAEQVTPEPLCFRDTRRNTEAIDGALWKQLKPSESVEAECARKFPAGPAVVRVRAAVEPGSDAVLRVTVAGKTVWNEHIIHRPSTDRTAGAALEFTRWVYTEKASPVVISNPGRSPLYLDGVELLSATAPGPRYEFGAHTSTALAYDGKKHGLTPDICKAWSHLRCTTRVWWIGSPDEGMRRWETFDNHVARYLALHAAPQFILEGTPRWAALSDARWLAGGKKPQMAVPDTASYVALAEHIVTTYADRVADWEIGNETTVHGFWNGTPGEYTTLFQAIEPVIRRCDPTARVISAGMAGVTQDSLDPFILAMSRSGAIRHTDLFGVHCYAENGEWDMPYGLAEGHLLALGERVELYPNEQGTMIRGGVDEEEQARQNSRGMARLLASGATKFIIFQSDGPRSGEAFGMLDENGRPRPAYAPFLDYLELAKDGGRRVPVSAVRSDGEPLAGIHVAAARHTDGSTTVLVNPDDSNAWDPIRPPETNLLSRAARGRWVRFFGTADWTDYDKGASLQKATDLAVSNAVVLKPESDRPMGFYYKAESFDPKRLSGVCVSLSNPSGKPWQMALKYGMEKTSVTLADTRDGGTFAFDFAQALPDTFKPQDIELSFRFSGEAQISRLVWVAAAEAHVHAPAVVPVDISVPLQDGSVWALHCALTGNRLLFTKR